jgi:hypothetical protein
VDFANIIQTVALYALPVLFAITVHEAAHGYAARHFGDNTAWHAGPRHAQPGEAHRPHRHHPDAAVAVLRHLGAPSVRLRQAGAGALRQPAQPQARHGLGGAGRPGLQPGQAMVWGALLYVLVASA